MWNFTFNLFLHSRLIRNQLQQWRKCLRLLIWWCKLSKNSKLFQKCFVYLIWSMFRENVKLIISKFRNFEFWFINFYSNFIKFTFNSPYSWLQLNICLSPRWPRLIFQGHFESKITFILFLTSRTESRDLHINQANF